MIFEIITPFFPNCFLIMIVYSNYDKNSKEEETLYILQGMENITLFVLILIVRIVDKYEIILFHI